MILTYLCTLCLENVNGIAIKEMGVGSCAGCHKRQSIYFTEVVDEQNQPRMDCLELWEHAFVIMAQTAANGVCRFNAKTIAEILGCSLADVYVFRKKLIEKGFVVRREEANHYGKEGVAGNLVGEDYYEKCVLVIAEAGKSFLRTWDFYKVSKHEQSEDLRNVVDDLKEPDMLLERSENEVELVKEIVKKMPRGDVGIAGIESLLLRKTKYLPTVETRWALRFYSASLVGLLAFRDYDTFITRWLRALADLWWEDSVAKEDQEFFNQCRKDAKHWLYKYRNFQTMNNHLTQPKPRWSTLGEIAEQVQRLLWRESNLPPDKRSLNPFYDTLLVFETNSPIEPAVKPKKREYKGIGPEDIIKNGCVYTRSCMDGSLRRILDPGEIAEIRSQKWHTHFNDAQPWFVIEARMKNTNDYLFLGASPSEEIDEVLIKLSGYLKTRWNDVEDR